MADTTIINSIEEALRALGVSEDTLSAAEKKALDEQGYLVFQGIMDAKWRAQLCEAFERFYQEQKKNGEVEKQKDTGTRHLEGLTNRDVVFDGIFMNPKVLAAVYHIIGREFRTMGLHGRDPLPGFGQQGLHADWLPRNPYEPFHVANTIWMLDDFTTESGPTRIVPGTHLLKGGPPKPLANPEANHPGQLFVTAPAGSVLVFNSHLWHSGTRNRSKKSRRSLQCAYVALDQRGYQTGGRIETYGREIPAAVRYIQGAFD